MTVGPKRILVVDDDAEIRQLLTSVLQQHELVVDSAGDGGAAMDLLRQFHYAVVLVDLMMPGMDGFALLDAQRIHGIVRKPFDPEEIAQLVVACAEIKSRGPFGAMAITAMLAGSPFLALLNRL